MSIKVDPKHLDSTGKTDFQIRLHLIECRELKGKGSNALSDPVGVVSVDGKKQTTEVFKNTLSCTFDHLMFFENKWKPEETQSKTVLIQIYDSNTIRRNVLIGQYGLDIPFVHGEKGHEIWHRWAIIINPEKETGAQGFIKFSCTVLGPGDESPTHENDDLDDDAEKEEPDKPQDLQSLILRPPQLDIVGYQLSIFCYRAEDLPKMDTFGKVDPFIEAHFGGNKLLRTKVKKKTFTPVWNEELRLPAYVPSLSNSIEIKLFDWERSSKNNDLISSTYFRFSDVQMQTVSPRWVNFYGPPKGNVRTMFKKGHTEETEYKGRALLALQASPYENPVLEATPVNSCKEPQVEKYVIRFDLFEGNEFNTNALENCFVELSIGKNLIRSKTLSTKKGTVSWYEQLKDFVVEFPADITQIPDLFINVYFKNKMLGKARVGFVRYKFEEINSVNNTPRWSMLEPDKKSPAYKSERIPGFLLYRIDAGKATTIAKYPRVKLSQPVTKKYEFRAYIYQGKDLPPADKTGLSDPYCVVRIGKTAKKTSRKEETLYPTWYEIVTFQVDLPEPLNLAPDVVVLCYDWDQIGGDDFLGRFSVKTSQLSKRFPPAPKWYDLWVDDPSIIYGSVLASFQLVPVEEISAYPLPKSIAPEFKDCLLQVSVVGLRGLLPFKMSRIKEPYIEFDLSQGTVQKDKERKKFTFTTEPSAAPSGSNPNHLQVFRAPVKIPLNHIFASSVMLRVFDKKSLGKKTIATGAISLAQFIPWANVPLENVNLPPIVDTIPGATKDGEPLDEDTEEEQKEIKIIPDEIPINIEEVNEEFEDAIVFDNRPSAGGFVGMRTIPDVDPQRPQFSDDDPLEIEDNEDEDPFKDPKKGKPKCQHELEHELKDIPFLEYELSRGKVRGLTFFEKMFRDKSLNPNTKRVVGKFKGNFKIYEETDKEKIEAEPNLKDLFRPKRMVVRAYILRGMSLVPKDPNGSSDPFIVVSTGKDDEFNFSDRENYHPKTLRPDFYKCYELPCFIPGNSELKISVYDYDKITSDDLIGVTTIDLENRWFCDEWKNMNPKPIEYRTLWAPTSRNPQGKLEMWIEILTEEEARNTPKTPLEAPKPESFELRAVAWNTKDVVFKDKRMSDIFITCQLNEGKRQKSDIHWRSTDGNGAFNWRFVFPLQLPTRVPRFKFQLWDQDILNPNDSIAEAVLNLHSFFKKAYRLKSEQNIKKQWIDMFHPNFQGKQGSLELQIDLLTEAEALAKPVGKGRKEPNDHPHLDQPIRPLSSIAPWRVDKWFKFGWKKHRGKVFCCLCSCCVCAIIIIIVLAKFAI
ncbi:c2 calcium-dependent membrane targeting [Anaeramoeba ignava]|uniref:C2 calcium-dependent membrane targeting n=1 Tax=Anaeramoeba ignava TaxID=1746090 RepID=A0A9Q0R6G5_ANAIG|nr:c2 calcium-dependent membrane targeting [Anaeramoeba ignava]